MAFKSIFTAKPILALEALVLLFFAFNVGKEMYKRHIIATQIEQLESEISRLDKNKNDLASLLNYVQTDNFIEQEARSKLNLAKEGESLVLFPNGDVAGELAVVEPALPVIEPIATSVVPKNKSNFLKWWQYFFEHDQLVFE